MPKVRLIVQMINRSLRINKQRIPYILKKGHTLKQGLFTVRYMENKEQYCRFITIVSKKIERLATKRNKIKRKIYEGIRLDHKILEKNPKLDILLIPHKQIRSSDYESIDKSLKELFSKLNN